MSACELFREEVVSAASVLARPRKNGDELGEEGDPMGETGDGKEKAGCEGDSELYECDREEIGTVRWQMFTSDDPGLVSAFRLDSSGGDSSGAGIGRPLAAATN